MGDKGIYQGKCQRGVVGSCELCKQVVLALVFYLQALQMGGVTLNGYGAALVEVERNCAAILEQQPCLRQGIDVDESAELTFFEWYPSPEHGHPAPLRRPCRGRKPTSGRTASVSSKASEI